MKTVLLKESVSVFHCIPRSVLGSLVLSFLTNLPKLMAVSLPSPEIKLGLGHDVLVLCVVHQELIFGAVPG